MYWKPSDICQIYSFSKITDDQGRPWHVPFLSEAHLYWQQATLACKVAVGLPRQRRPSKNGSKCPDTWGSYPRIYRKTTGPQIHERSTNEFVMCTKTEGDRVTLKWKPAEIRGKEHDLLAHQNIGYLRCPGPDFLCAFQPVTMIRPAGGIYILNFVSA